MDPADKSVLCMMTLFKYFCHQAAKSASYQPLSQPQVPCYQPKHNDGELAPVPNPYMDTFLARGGPHSIMESSALDIKHSKKKCFNHRYKASPQPSSSASPQLSSPSSLQFSFPVSLLPSFSASPLPSSMEVPLPSHPESQLSSHSKPQLPGHPEIKLSSHSEFLQTESPPPDSPLVRALVHTSALLALRVLVDIIPVAASGVPADTIPIVAFLFWPILFQHQGFWLMSLVFRHQGSL